MDDPVLWVGAGVLIVLSAGPLVAFVRPLFGRVFSRLRGAAAVGVAIKTVPIVPSRYRWSGQEIASLEWASHQIPTTVTLAEFVDAANVDDTVSETCVSILSPAKEAGK